MIPAQKNRFVETWFQGYVHRYLRRSFHRMLISGDAPEIPDGPLIVCMSHSSWWDPLLAFWLSRELLGWDGYGVMEERQLRRYPLFTRIGAFGVERESLRGGREFLQYANGLLRGRRRALWLTVQGAMVSNAVRPLRFYSGVASLVQGLGTVHLTTVVLDYEFWNEKRPEAFVSFAPVLAVTAGPAFSRKAFLRDLEGRMEQQMEALADRQRQRDPSLFRIALAGGEGISPTYDALCRAGAWLRGTRYLGEHAAVATPPRWGPGRRG